jgi:uncharacterized protein
VNSSFLTSKAVVRLEAGARSTVCCDAIGRGETIAAFGGSCVPRAVLDTLGDERRRRSSQIDEDLFMVAAEQEEPGDQINHSCNPNCGIVGGVVVVSLRDIAVGEELTFDYAMTDGCDYDEFDCTCGRAQCRGRITGNDWMLPDLQLRYRGSFSPYLARRIANLVSLGAERRAFSY